MMLAILIILLIFGILMLLYEIITRKRMIIRGVDKKKNHSKFNKNGFNNFLIHKNGTYFDDKGYDYSGYDIKGYDIKGFNRQGYDKNGYDNNGYDSDGFDLNGYNKRQFNENKIHKNETIYDDQGFDFYGYNINGFNNKSIHKNGTKFDELGYDIDGFNNKGFNSKSIHKNGTKFDELGYDIDGFDNKGFNSKSIHKNGTKFDDRGYDVNGFDLEMYSKDGVSKDKTIWWYEPKKELIKSNYYSKFFNLKYKKKTNNKDSIYIFVNNSFNVLGLTINVENNEINRRTIELEKFSKIDIKREYDNDFEIELINRDLKNIKLSRDKLNNIELIQKEMFFWFDDSNVSIIKDNNIELSLFNLKVKYSESNEPHVLKDIILLEIYYSITNNDSKKLQNTLSKWDKVINNESFWNYFSLKIKSTQQFEIEDSSLSLFKKNITNYIADFYYDLSKQTTLTNINNEFYRKYNLLSQKYLNEVLFKELQESDRLTNVINDIRNSYNDKQITVSQKRKINSTIKEYNSFNNDLRKKGILDLPEIVIKNDIFVESVRNLSVKLFNNTKDKDTFKYSLKILEDVKEVLTSNAVKTKLNNDIKDISKQNKMLDLMDEFNSNLSGGYFTLAERNIDAIERLDSSHENKQFCARLRIRVIKEKSYKGYEDAMKKANELAKYGGYFGVSDLIETLESALVHLGLIAMIAEKENNNQEYREAQKAISHLNDQIRQLKYRR